MRRLLAYERDLVDGNRDGRVGSMGTNRMFSAEHVQALGKRDLGDALLGAGGLDRMADEAGRRPGPRRAWHQAPTVIPPPVIVEAGGSSSWTMCTARSPVR